MPKKNKLTRILAIDGGGIRGIIPGVVLGILEKKLQKLSGEPGARLADYFDLMAGTSTGGILSCCYLLADSEGRPKFGADEIVELYFKHGGEIFKRSLFHRIRTASGVLDEKYPDKGLRKTLKRYLGDALLSQQLRPSLITAYDIEQRRTHFFTSQDAHRKGNDFLARDVAWSTSAAPTYFEVARVKDDLNRDYALIDGGMYAGNPTLCGYAEARKLFKKPGSEQAVTAADMLVLSVGTGSAKQPYPYERAKDWGMAEWAKPLIDIMLSGGAETVDYQVRQIYDAVNRPEQYLRINGPLPESVNHAMDDASEDNMEALRREGQTLAERYDDELQCFAELLVSTEPCDLIA